MHTRFISFTLLASVALSATAVAQSGEGRRLSELAFETIDGAERGFIDHGEFSNFGELVFTSMDNDEDKKLSLDEFLSWGFGMEQAAEEVSRAEALETAMRVVFAFWDRDGDGQISKTEHRHALLDDFRRADTDNNAIVTKEEFLTGFSVIVAARAAINPPPAN